MSKYFSIMSFLFLTLGIVSIFSGNNGFMLFTFILINIYLLVKIKGKNGLTIGFYGFLFSMLFGGVGLFLYSVISYITFFTKGQNE